MALVYRVGIFTLINRYCRCGAVVGVEYCVSIRIELFYLVNINLCYYTGTVLLLLYIPIVLIIQTTVL